MIINMMINPNMIFTSYVTIMSILFHVIRICIIIVFIIIFCYQCHNDYDHGYDYGDQNLDHQNNNKRHQIYTVWFVNIIWSSKFTDMLSSLLIFWNHCINIIIIVIMNIIIKIYVLSMTTMIKINRTMMLAMGN